MSASTDVRAIPFAKMEAVGNDFVVVKEMDIRQGEESALAQEMCSRRFGIGSDGLLVLGASDRADLRVRMFNPDGTEDHCGNGMRCAVLMGLEPLTTGQERDLTLETIAGLKRTRLYWIGGEPSITTDMGEPAFHPSALPMSVDVERVVDYPIEVEGETLPVTVVSTGTTHAVLFAEDAQIAEQFERISPALERHPLFPERTSVLWATLKDSDMIHLRIWERGVGETLGCGTGACAAMIAARLRKAVGNRAMVVSPGGALEVFWPGEGSCTLTGGARVVYRGVWGGRI